jgi:hypothetical protein
MIVFGCDPGVTGGLAFLDTVSRTVQVFDIPSAAGEVDAGAIVALIEQYLPKVGIVERASSRPGQGVAFTFKYGVAYGALLTTLALNRIPCHRPTPTQWKKQFGLDKDKEKSRLMAIRLFPGCGGFSRKKDHGRAEAALIAKYGAEVILRTTREES